MLAACRRQTLLVSRKRLRVTQKSKEVEQQEVIRAEIYHHHRRRHLAHRELVPDTH